MYCCDKHTAKQYVYYYSIYVKKKATYIYIYSANISVYYTDT